jgi:hypothetical protein
MSEIRKLSRAGVGKFPWVRVLKRPADCDAIVRSRNALCTRTAWWSFSALPSSSAASARYCLVHLHQLGLYADDQEARRTDRWVANHPEEFAPAAPGEDVKLDLSQDEDLAVFVSLVPEWAELAEGIDLHTEAGKAAYRDRLQTAVDEAVRRLGITARALQLLPPPD